MRRRLLSYLCCPECLGALALEAWQPRAAAEDAEIEEGLLTCQACQRPYPIIRGVPRMLPDALAHLVPQFHAAFFRVHAEALRAYGPRCRKPDAAWWRAETRTVRSYSYQWRKFKQMFPAWEQVFRDTIRPVEQAFFPGKVGLDAGCGFGRSLHYAAQWGAEMIGLDLSEAVEAARENTRALPLAHVVQGDIFHPPVRRQALDFVYSIGVLHHLPDPEAGFRSLTRLLKPGAPIFVWVYARGRGRQIPILNGLRAVSTRLPLRLLDALCLVGAAAQWALWILPHRALRRWRLTRPLAARLPFTQYAPYPFRVLHTDWVDGFAVPLQQYHTREEIAGWCARAGLERVHIAEEWGGRALAYQPAPGVPATP